MPRAIRIKHDGEELTINEWSKKTGIAKGTIVDRLKKGWTPEKALTIDPNQVQNRDISLGKLAVHSIKSSWMKIWEDEGRTAFEQQLADAFQADALKTVKDFQFLFPKEKEIDNSTPPVAIQINNYDAKDMARYEPI